VLLAELQQIRCEQVRTVEESYKTLMWDNKAKEKVMNVSSGKHNSFQAVSP